MVVQFPDAAVQQDVPPGTELFQTEINAVLLPHSVQGAGAGNADPACIGGHTDIPKTKILCSRPKKRLSFFPDYGKEKNFPEFSSDEHGERFRYPLREADFSPETKPAENPKILVFNYKFRDPLTGNAAVKVLPE